MYVRVGNKLQLFCLRNIVLIKIFHILIFIIDYFDCFRWITLYFRIVYIDLTSYVSIGV